MINQLTSMHENVKYDTAQKRTSNLRKNKSQQSEERFETLDLKTLLKFIWAYRFDYLAYGYNPFTTVNKFLQIEKSIKE